MKTYAVILAAGASERFSGGVSKQFVRIAGRTVLEHTLAVFESAEEIDEIILVIPAKQREKVQRILSHSEHAKVHRIVEGGETRRESSARGIESIPEDVQEGYVIIHDCARPFVTRRIIRDCLYALRDYSAVDVAIPTSDTIICVNERDIIEQIPERARLRRGQTPQAFRLSLIRQAHREAHPETKVTDDCGLVLEQGLSPIKVVRGERTNIKLTWPEDLYLTDKIFQVQGIDMLPPHEERLGKLRGRVVVLFGGSGGIGAALAEKLRKIGAIVNVFSRSVGNCDITDYSSVQQKLAQVHRDYGRLHAVVNTAGSLGIGKLQERDAEEIRREVDVNFMGSINVCKAAIPYLRSTRGSILLFASSSYTHGRAGYSPYSACKAAIVNLVQALAEELHPEGICINAVSPARTKTPMREVAFGKEDDEGSLLDPDSVAETAMHALVAPDLTGQVINVNQAI